MGFCFLSSPCKNISIFILQKAYLKQVLDENPSLPCFCFGHSTGAAIILKAVLDPKIKKLVKGIAITSPAVHVQPSHPIVMVIVCFLFIIYSILLTRLIENEPHQYTLAEIIDYDSYRKECPHSSSFALIYL